MPRAPSDESLIKKGARKVPQRRTAIKELRKTHKRHMHNLDIKSDLRKTIKHFTDFVSAKKKSEAQKALTVLFKKIDKAAKRNVFHKNTAARRKSRFNRLLLNLSK